MNLYFTSQGSVIRKEGDNLLVDLKEENKKQALEIIHVNSILCYGSIHVTEPAMKILLENGIDLSFFSIYGQYYGKLQSAFSKNIPLRMKQYQISSNNEKRLEISKNIVEGKLLNQAKMIKVHLHAGHDEELKKHLDEIERLAEATHNANSIDSLLGYEGSGARSWFAALAKMNHGELHFDGRKGHPPADEFNALLSFGYVVLSNEIESMLEGHGLDPFAGILHGTEYGRASLALDLVEALRSPVIDRLTLRMSNLRISKPGDFEPVNGGVYMGRDMKRHWFQQYEKIMNDTEYYGMTVREIISEECRKIINCIGKGEPFVSWHFRRG